MAISSMNYFAAGIDLRDLEKLDKFIQAQCQEDDEILFISEVAITYMPVRDADALVKWASKFSNGRFVLIEQILPAGETHPFASTMLSHFKKINSPLQNIGTYPTLSSQVQRFRGAGWKSATACDLYGAWCNLISEQEKSFIESVEAFDEHEDFVLFGQHYFFLCANTGAKCYNPIGNDQWLNGDRSSSAGSIGCSTEVKQSPNAPVIGVTLTYNDNKQPGFAMSRRKYGAASVLNSTSSIYNGGIDNKARLSSTYIYDHTSGSFSELRRTTEPQARQWWLESNPQSTHR
ncbi:hypothetical protein H072_2706 [Dactylellina haptotyla CBS 200.50]|uniref:Uncharacterized protein n=1 Tax=Dactylellina haptotyla (strain CBS 200.50) TaxID=1284197 RepID=S8BUY3_DACHA|nr:hypothetical protein H072_2706 [Dactylellina haptotyla CBS 200.50]